MLVKSFHDLIYQNDKHPLFNLTGWFPSPWLMSVYNIYSRVCDSSQVNKNRTNEPTMKLFVYFKKIESKITECWLVNEEGIFT